MTTTQAGFGHGPDTIRLGDYEVPRLGFGAMRLPGPDVWGEPSDRARAIRVVRRAYELGMRLIDTSWYYGPHVANEIIAEAIHPYPKDLVIAAKLGGKRTPDKGWAPFNRPEQLREGCETDLRTLKVERLDIVHYRWIGIPGNEALFDEGVDALIELKNQGKISHVALSNVNEKQLSRAIAKTPIVSVQNMYAAGTGGTGPLAKMAHCEVDDPDGVLRACEKHRIAFMPFFPLAVGKVEHARPQLVAIAKKHGKTPSQIALAWLLARSPVMLPIPGTSSPEHLEENWASRSIRLSDDEMSAITNEASA